MKNEITLIVKLPKEEARFSSIKKKKANEEISKIIGQKLFEIKNYKESKNQLPRKTIIIGHTCSGFSNSLGTNIVIDGRTVYGPIVITKINNYKFETLDADDEESKKILTWINSLSNAPSAKEREE